MVNLDGSLSSVPPSACTAGGPGGVQDAARMMAALALAAKERRA